MPADEIIDLSESGRRAAAFRRRRLMRIIVPVQFVLILMVCIGAILYFNYQSNRREALELSDVVIQTTAERIETEVVSYLSPAEQMVRMGSTKAGKYPELPFALNPSYSVGLDPAGSPVSVKGPTPMRLQALSIDMLETYQQLAMVNIADDQGSFVMPKRMPDGSIDTKIIDRRGGRVAQVQWIRRNAQGEVIEVEQVPSEEYDPRTRPWYQGAVESDGLFWTNVYILFTDRKPGVTAAYPVHNNGGELTGVFGVDIELDAICSFLDKLEIGQTGRAVIVDSQGRIVAHPDVEKTMKEVGGNLETVPIQELGDAALIRVYNRYRIDGPGAFALDIDGELYRGSATQLPETVGNGWTVLLVVPEVDYVGFVNEKTRQTAWLSAGVLAVIAVFTCFVVVQGVRADATAQKVIEREGELLEQGRAFARLSEDAGLLDPGDDAALKGLTEAAAHAVRVMRVGVWLIDGDTLRCLDAYDRSGAGHVSGTELDLRTMPGLMRLIRERELLAAADVAAEPRLRELDELYLTPLRHDSVLVCPIMKRSGSAGLLIFEGSRRSVGWSGVTQSFARSLASLLRARLDTDAHPAAMAQPVRVEDEAAAAGVAGADADARVASAELEAETPSAAQIAPPSAAAQAIDRSAITELQGRVYDHAAILVVVCADRRETTGRAAQTTRALTLLHALSCMVDRWASQRPGTTVSLAGDRLVIATGLADDEGASDNEAASGGEPAAALAHLALGLQQVCRERDPGDLISVKMGIDLGPVEVAALGSNGNGQQVTGPVLAVAGQLAERASGDAVQVSDRAFQMLRSHFLLQRRGRFYAAGVGTLGTYFLTGELEGTS